MWRRTDYHRPSPGRSTNSARYAAAILILAVFGTISSACNTQSASLNASGPFPYPANVSAQVRRVAILVSITNRSSDDVQVNLADFLARDDAHHIFPANPAAMGADGDLVRLATGPRPEALPLPNATLRQAEVLSGFIVFDVPEGIRPVEVIWRQSDSDQVVRLTSAS